MTYVPTIIEVNMLFVVEKKKHKQNLTNWPGDLNLTWTAIFDVTTPD